MSLFARIISVRNFVLPVLQISRQDVQQQRQGALLDVDVENGQQQVGHLFQFRLEIKVESKI